MAQSDRLTGSKAMQITGLSRHSFEKIVNSGLITRYIDEKEKKYYLQENIDEFMV